MMIRRVLRMALVTAAALTLFAIPACSDDPQPTAPVTKVCSPGASTACVGPGGCSGGQVCNAEGSGYLTCDCGGTDAAVVPDTAGDTGSVDSGPDVVPTQGALRVSWTLETSSGAATTCAGVATQGGVAVTLTRAGTTDVINHTFDCSPTRADIVDLPFGTYEVVVDLLNTSDMSIGSSPKANVTLAAAPCDALISGDCGKVLDVKIRLD